MPINQALIFAAGLGKRMRPLTESLPKPLLPVCGKPLIQHLIEKLAGAGVQDLVINTHWQADKLVSALDDGHHFGVEIQWSHEPDILDTGGGIKNALPLLADAPFLLVGGDIWTDYDFANLVDKKPPETGAHLVMVPNPPHHQAGDFAITESGLLSDSTDMDRYTYSGFGVFTPGFISKFGSDEKVFPLREALQAGMACGKVSAEIYRGDWEDVGTPERLVALEERLKI